MKQKQILAVFLAGAMLLTFAGCKAPSKPETQPAQTVPATEAKADFSELLSGRGGFYSRDYQKTMTLPDYLDTFAAETGTDAAFPRSACLDLDGDGEEELLVCLQANSFDYGTLVLHRQAGRAEGWLFAYRQMFDLKADGSFACSASDLPGSFAKLQFTEEGWQYVPIPGEGQDAKESAQWTNIE